MTELWVVSEQQASATPHTQHAFDCGDVGDALRRAPRADSPVAISAAGMRDVALKQVPG